MSEGPDSSPILKSGSSSLRASVSLPEPPTFEALNSSSSSRVGSQETSKTHIRVSQPATSEVPNSSISLKSYTSSCHKRSHRYSLLSDDGPDDCEDLPTKKSKPLLTTYTYDRSSEAEIYFNQHMLELSHISRRAFAAKMEYQRLRAEELELMTSLLKDEMEEAHGHLTKTDLQIGSLRNDLHDAGVAVIGSKGRKDAKEIGNRLFPGCGDHKADDSSDYHSSVSSECNGGVDENWGAPDDS